MITRTGLGLQLNSILVNTARSITENPTAVLIFTAVFAALAVSVLGLAVPVTASFVISWVIIGPALQDLGVRRSRRGDVRLLFRGAVRSDPADRTGGRRRIRDHRRPGDRDDVQTWKYTLPAFLVPFAFVLTDNGEGLLGLRSLGDMAWTAAVAALAVAALAVVTGGWLVRSRGLAGAAAVRAGGWTAALPEPGDHRGGGRAVGGGRGGESHHSQTTSGITRSAASRYPRYGGYIRISLGQ